MKTQELLIKDLKILYPKMRGYNKDPDIIIDKICDESHLAKLADKIHDRLNCNIKEYIGGGQYGRAYLLDDGRVLKLTTDYVELKVSYHLKSVLHYYDIFIVDIINDNKSNIIGGIVQPKASGRTIRDVDKNLARILKLMWESKKFDEKTLLSLIDASEHQIKIFKSIKKQLDILRKYGLLNFDFNPTNIFIDDDYNAYLIDFGGSSKIEFDVDISELGKPLALEDKIMISIVGVFSEECI